METLDKVLLEQMLKEGYVMVQKHPTEELFIYNYTAVAQYERVWNEATLQCRGLILDKEQNIVARPFRKFFNLGEHENQVIPNESFEVYEKMDGSLGILYWLDGEAFIATRGSFASDQAIKATEILREKYSSVLPSLEKDKTYLFEIIYPENRIVVDYGKMEDLVLLAIVDNKTGNEVQLEEVGFPVVKRYDGINDLSILAKLEESNREGFVVKFTNGLRYKIKFQEYLRVHRIVTQVSNISIWEFLKAGESLDEVLERVPDEFYDWVKKTNKDLCAAFKEIEEKAKCEFKVLETRKDTALYFQKCKYPGVLFNMLDGKDYSKAIWRMLRPQFSKPFSNYEE